MKQIVGALFTLVILFVTTHLVLLMWGVNLMSGEHFVKTLITIGILTILTLLLVILLPFFFKNEKKNYDQKQGNVAHPRK